MASRKRTLNEKDGRLLAGKTPKKSSVQSLKWADEEIYSSDSDDENRNSAITSDEESSEVGESETAEQKRMRSERSMILLP